MAVCFLAAFSCAFSVLRMWPTDIVGFWFAVDLKLNGGLNQSFGLGPMRTPDEGSLYWVPPNGGLIQKIPRGVESAMH